MEEWVNSYNRLYTFFIYTLPHSIFSAILEKIMTYFKNIQSNYHNILQKNEEKKSRETNEGYITLLVMLL